MSEIDVSELPERPNETGLAVFAERAGGDGDGPVVMLNLLVAGAVTPLLERVGGRIVYAAAPAPPLLGDDAWDVAALVEYPSRQAFLDMVTAPEYKAAAHLRTEALARGELHPMEPLFGAL